MIYTIRETRQVTQCWTYEVEAPNAEEALTLVQDGEVAVTGFEAIDGDYDFKIIDRRYPGMEYEVIDFRESGTNRNDDGPEYDSAGYSIEDREG